MNPERMGETEAWLALSPIERIVRANPQYELWWRTSGNHRDCDKPQGEDWPVLKWTRLGAGHYTAMRGEVVWEIKRRYASKWWVECTDERVPGTDWETLAECQEWACHQASVIEAPPPWGWGQPKRKRRKR